MTTRRNQKSKSENLLSDLENMDVMLGNSHFERDLDQMYSMNGRSNRKNPENQHFESANNNNNPNENSNDY